MFTVKFFTLVWLARGRQGALQAKAPGSNALEGLLSQLTNTLGKISVLIPNDPKLDSKAQNKTGRKAAFGPWLVLHSGVFFWYVQSIA